MPDTKISLMTPAATFGGTELLPLVQAGGNVRGSISQVSPFLKHDVWSADKNILRFGKNVYPASYFPDTNNSYFVIDAGDTSSDASIVMRVLGNARFEVGIVGAVTDSVINQSFRIKSITGSYGAEVFTDRFVVTDIVNPRYPAIDIYGAPGEDPFLRLYANTGRAVFSLGTINEKEFPDGTGTGLQLIYSLDNDAATIQAITWDAYYRDIHLNANNFRLHSGAVFLVDSVVVSNTGAVVLGDPIQLAASANVSNTGADGIALMSGYVPGTDVLTALGGTGTAPTFSVTNTQVSRVNSIVNGGTGGTPGGVLCEGTTGTGTKFKVVGIVSAGGVLTSVQFAGAAIHGNYTVNPTNLADEPVTGTGVPTGARLNISMGALTVVKTTNGALTVTPPTPVSTSSNAAGTGATLDITYQNSFGSINALEYWANGIRVINSSGAWLGSVGGPSVAIDNGAGAQALLSFIDGGTNKFALAKQTDNSFIGYDYVHSANFLLVGTAGSLQLGETGVAGVQIGSPTGGDLGSGAINVQNEARAGSITAREITYAARPGSPVNGQQCNFSDSNTSTWGATIAGGGSNKILGRYNGTNWTVVGA